jgi:hypothetical protein
MIEINRYIRVKPGGLSWGEATADQGGGLYVYFKRFDVENGKEIEPERSFLKFEDLEARLAEMEKQSVAIRELLLLKPAPPPAGA